jgi:hypothetical protein
MATLIAVAGAILFAVAMLVMFFQRVQNDAVLDGPYAVAEEFLSRLKHGEDVCPAAGQPERPGYVAAYELLSEERRRTWPFEDFYQLFLLRQNVHGPLVVSRPQERSVRKGGREATAQFLLGFGHDEGAALHEETLELKLQRLSGRWLITECNFPDAGALGR